MSLLPADSAAPNPRFHYAESDTHSHLDESDAGEAADVRSTSPSRGGAEPLARNPQPAASRRNTELRALTA